MSYQGFGRAGRCDNMPAHAPSSRPFPPDVPVLAQQLCARSALLQAGGKDAAGLSFPSVFASTRNSAGREQRRRGAACRLQLLPSCLRHGDHLRVIPAHCTRTFQDGPCRRRRSLQFRRYRHALSSSTHTAYLNAFLSDAVLLRRTQLLSNTLHFAAAGGKHRSMKEPIMKSSPWALVFTCWLIAAISTLGALFFSEVMGLPPCVLCWYQRIFMFPLVFVLAAGLFPFDPKIVRYALPLALVGGLIAVFQLLLVAGYIPESITPCTQGVPCSKVQIEWFGFVTIPLLSAAAFSLIIALLIATHIRTSK
jgi:disulfide bond formation protein DsbB